MEVMSGRAPWWVWLVVGLLTVNGLVSFWAAIRPVVPVTVLTNSIVSLGGDTRILQLRIQQLEGVLQQAQAEIERLRKAGGK